MFEACEICGANDWNKIYQGDIRDGAFGKVQNDATVAQCNHCQSQRLGEQWCIQDSYYETGEYRAKLQQNLDTNSYFSDHDNLQIFALQNLKLPTLRGKTIADIGCAGGSFLDHVNGLAKKAIAVEPFSEYHSSLKQRNYDVYPYASDAGIEQKNQVDMAFSFQVIEHILNPVKFLRDIAPMLKPGGTITLSTPNRNDVLMALLPEDYPSFFYRVVHRWYFNEQSLAQCAKIAGYDVINTKYVHRYNLANALRWLRDKKPTGNSPLDVIDAQADAVWKSSLENAGTSDCLFMTLTPTA